MPEAVNLLEFFDFDAILAPTPGTDNALQAFDFDSFL